MISLMDAPRTLQQAILYFSNYANCHKAVEAIRWPDGVVKCPTCGSEKVTYLAKQRRWKCYEQHPKPQFSLKVGTIFEDSPIGLDKWFTAMWLIAGAKNGISSYEVHRAIAVTQKTAWFMLHRIRLAMQTKTFNKTGGEVEVDERYIGGQGRRHGTAGERHGKEGHSVMRTEVILDRKRRAPRTNRQAHQAGCDDPHGRIHRLRSRDESRPDVQDAHRRADGRTPRNHATEGTT